MDKTKKIFQGFDVKELLDLFTFLLIYEKHLSGFKKDKTMYKSYPFMEDVFNKFNKAIKNEIKGQNQLNNYNMEELNKHIYYTSSNKSNKNHSVLRHLRNTIAHGLIEKDEKYILIRDFWKKKPSAVGRLKINKVMTLINSIVNNISL